MSIPVVCPHCEADLSVHDRLAGKETKCPHCGGAFSVPTVSVVQEALEDDIVDVEEVDEVEQAYEAVEVVNSAEEVAVAARHQTIGNSGLARGESSRSSDEDSGEIEEVNFPKKELPTDDMDMTPMVDVTFLLLIFFMITASFSSEKAFEEPPPLPTDAVSVTPPTNSDSIRVQIDEFNAYTIIFSGGDEREASSKQELLIALDEAKNEMATGSKNKDDEIKLLIEAHVDCIHGAVIAAVDAARDRGFNSFQVQVVEEFQ
jgi:biopolymer transport protein ExbD